MINRIILPAFIALTAMVSGAHAFAERSPMHDLEYFSYCSNGMCRLINGDFFHQDRNMPVDLNVSCKKPNQYALTFDDGPSQNYPRLLEVLKRHHVKATFFIVGHNLETESGKQWFRQAFSDGHYMANHTYQHDDLTTLNSRQIITTIEKTRTAMLETLTPDQNRQRLERSSKVLRPPFGNIDMKVDEVLKANGYTSVRWNADRYDWNMPGNDPDTTATILARVRQQFDFIAKQVEKGETFNPSIMDLNHDWQPTTVDAIESLIGVVESKGYQFVTMDECLGVA